VLGKTADALVGIRTVDDSPVDVSALIAGTLPRSDTVYRDDLLRRIYRETKTVAMVGASPNWNRPRYFVLRMERHVANARVVAEFLAGHPAVA
jgi:cystathionine beta-lyase/cystathionine gamma-synthase